MESSTVQLPHNDEEITEQTLLAFLNLMKQELKATEPPSVPPAIADSADPYIDIFGEGVCECVKKEEVAEEDEEMKPERPTQKTEPAMK